MPNKVPGACMTDYETIFGALPYFYNMKSLNSCLGYQALSCQWYLEFPQANSYWNAKWICNYAFPISVFKHPVKDMTLQWLSLAAIQSLQSRASYRLGKKQKQTCHQFSVNPFSFESKQSRAFPARVINSHNCGFPVSFVSAAGFHFRFKPFKAKRIQLTPN